eukprot:1157312-Pelagomonas_calceolata.AAC.12
MMNSMDMHAEELCCKLELNPDPYKFGPCFLASPGVHNHMHETSEVRAPRAHESCDHAHALISHDAGALLRKNHFKKGQLLRTTFDIEANKTKWQPSAVASTEKEQKDDVGFLPKPDTVWHHHANFQKPC